MYMQKSLSHVQLYATPWCVAYQAPWDSPGKKTGVGCHVLLQGIFPTQGWNPGILQTLVPSAPPGRHTHN